MLPDCQFAYRKGLSTCDALLYITQSIQSWLDTGVEARIVQLDFSSAFDRVNHKALLQRLSILGVGGRFLALVSS
jgi:hypothetical protein